MSGQKHAKIIPIQADVTDKASLLRAAEQIESEQGFVDLVVANAGIVGPGMARDLPAEPTLSQLRGQLLSWDTDALTETYAVNTVGIITTVAAFLELLDAGNKRSADDASRQKSQVVAVSSIGGFSRSPVGGWAYPSSKAAVTHLVKTMATKFVPFDIRANVIAPGCEYLPFSSTTFSQTTGFG